MKFKNTNLVFSDNYILEPVTNKYVMMDWEKNIMKEHSNIVCHNKGDILEIGFGMGISANYIHNYKPKSHTIIEIHPQVLERLYEWAKNKDNVKIIEGDWYKNLDILETYDGILFDTYNEKNDPKILINYLKTNGLFTFYNGLQEINYLGLDCEYKIIDVENVPKNHYFNHNKYYLPVYKNKK